ncbi:MAG: DUF1592 domain-containing protein [Cellvibrionaceae bacterium]
MPVNHLSKRQQLKKISSSNNFIGLILIGLLSIQGCSKKNETEGAEPQVRRLTEAQYRNTIKDIFGEDIKVVGRFEPEMRIDGLLAVGTSEVSITTAGYEQYFSLARNIANQVFDDDNISELSICDEAVIDSKEKCAKQFISQWGAKVFRRPLSDQETSGWVKSALDIFNDSGNFTKGLEYALSGMLISPDFLFIIDNVEQHKKSNRLTAYSKASRLSYALWNTLPDQQLFDSAKSGKLHDTKELELQVNRMLEDSRVKQGVAAFFADFLQLDRFDILEKDKIIYPAFNQSVAASAKEQVIKLVLGHLVDNQKSYLDLYTTRDTWMNRDLGVIYAVPVVKPDGWEIFEFPKGDPRSGLLSHVGFTALHSHPGRSSATLRGIAIRDLLLCQPVAPAPAAVNFTVVQDTENPEFKTARERLTQHRTDDACSGCHKVIDPIGLALESFDGAGQFRLKENGEMIDTSGEIDGMTFADANELGAAIKKHPATSACLAEKATKYALGRSISPAEYPWVKGIEASFAKNNFNVISLFKEIVTDKSFYKVKVPEIGKTAEKYNQSESESLAGSF